MPALILTQNDNAAPNGVNVGCSGASLQGAISRECVNGGAVGSAEATADPGNATSGVASVMFQSDVAVGETTWDSGDYVVRINVSATRGCVWVATYICERTSGGAFNTIASLTGQSISMGTSGVKTMTINRATNFAAAVTSTLYIVCLFDGTAHGGSAFGFIPDQNIDTPIQVAGDIVLVVADSDHLHTADNLDLVQASVLAVNDADHLHDADNIILDAGAAFGDLIKQDSVANTSLATFSPDLGSNPKSGNLLIVTTGAGESSALVDTPPAGFTLLTENVDGAGIWAWWYKISVGTEQTISVVWDVAINGMTHYVEYEWDGSTPVIHSNDNIANINVATNSQPSGQAQGGAAKQILLAAHFTDGNSNSVTGQAVDGSWIEDIAFSANDVNQGEGKLSRLVNVTGLQEATHTDSDAGDQMYGAIAVFDTGGSPIITPASVTTLDTTSPSGDLLDVTLSASGNDRILVIANLVKDNTATAAEVTSITVDAGGINRTIGAGVVLQGTRQVAQESTFSNQVEIYFVLEADLPALAGEIDIDTVMDSAIDSNYWVAFEITGCPQQAFDAIVQNFSLDDVAADVQFDESITPTVDNCLIVDFWSISHSTQPVFTNAETLVAEMKDANGSIVVTQFTQGSAAAKTMAHEIDQLSQRRAWNVISFAPGGDTVLIVQDSDHLHDAELLALIQANVLALLDSDHLNIADNVVLVQANVLAMNDSDHLHDAENLVLDVSVTLVVADSDHLHDAENLDLVQANILAVAEAFCAHVADNLDLTQANVLALADSDHLHDAENLVLDVSVQLIVDDSDHLHTADNLDLLQANILAVAEAFSAHVADNLDLIQANVLVVADSDHLHDAESIVLTVSIALVVADSDHVHTGENVDLIQAAILAIDDAFHDNIADNIALSSGLTLIISDAVHQVVSDNINLFDPLGTLPEGIVFTIDGKDRVFVINTKDRVFVILPSNRV